MESLKNIIRKRKALGPVHARYEFQEYGIYLSEELHDPKHKSFYIKLAKIKPRGILEEAKGFAKDYNSKSVNRGKLFMWKLKELETGSKGKTRRI